VGVLADAAGDDRYLAAAHAGPTGDDDRSSRAQGVGWGQRPDEPDGPSSAGGLGALVDGGGDDTYEAAGWSLGAGYWLGTGVVVDGGGDDRYRSTYYSQASAAHVASGVLVDAGGNDAHLLVGRGGAGLGFGWDFANALLVDERGTDRYQARLPSLGRAALGSHAFFVELEGDDDYRLATAGLGSADVRAPSPASTRPWPPDATTLGLFIDAQGDDAYWKLHATRGTAAAFAGRGNDRAWHDPAPGASGGEHYGLGLDAPSGFVPELGSPAP